MLIIQMYDLIVYQLINLPLKSFWVCKPLTKYILLIMFDD